MFKGFQNTSSTRYSVSNKHTFDGFESNTPAINYGTGSYPQEGALQAHWKSSEGIAMSGTSASTWTDSVGGNVLTFGTNVFTYRDSMFNNYPSIRLTNTATSAGDVLDIGTNAGWTMAFLLRGGTSFTSARIWGGKTGSVVQTTAGEYSIRNDGAAQFYDTGAVVTGSSFAATSGGYGKIDLHVGTWDFTNGLIAAYVNDSSGRTNTISTTPTNYNTAANFTLNPFTNNDTTFVEVIVWNVALSSDEVKQLARLLASKYQIPIATTPTQAVV